MKSLFHQFYRLSESEFNTLWKECFFALDANVLLNLYRYSEGTAEQLISLLERLGARVVVPYQFALEFQRNRVIAINEQVKNYRDAEATLKRFDDEQVKPKRKHPFLSSKAAKALRLIQDELEASRTKHEGLFSTDPYLDRITKLVGKVGDPPTDVAVLHTKAKERFSREVPPGYEDKAKGEPDCYGDCLGWFELMDIAKASQKPLILVSDDGKEDWWQICGGRTLGPRPELRAEFFEISGQIFHMYSSDHFMEYANTYLAENVSPSAIEEVKEHLREVMRANTNKPSSVNSLGMPEKPNESTAPILKEVDLKASSAEEAIGDDKQDLKPTDISQVIE